MSQLSSGNEFHRHSYSFAMDDPSRVGEVRRFALGLCTHLGFDEVRKARVSIVINELGNNLVRHATQGQLLIRQLHSSEKIGVDIMSLDHGPGLDIDVVLTDGYSTGSTPGTGLGAVQRQSDEFDLYSQQSRGYGLGTHAIGTVLWARIYASESALKTLPNYEVGAVSIPLKGELVCGDGWTVHQQGDQLRAMVVDGLGHGPNACIAATEAIDVFEKSTHPSLDQLMQLIHGRLKSTRGGAVFLVDVGGGSVNYTGVGNISTTLLATGQAKTLLSHNGTAGVQIRTMSTMVQAWSADGTVVMHSDGIKGRWDLTAYAGLQFKHPALIAGILYRDFPRGSDDATVLVMRRRL